MKNGVDNATRDYNSAVHDYNMKIENVRNNPGLYLSQGEIETAAPANTSGKGET